MEQSRAVSSVSTAETEQFWTEGVDALQSKIGPDPEPVTQTTLCAEPDEASCASTLPVLRVGQAPGDLDDNPSSGAPVEGAATLKGEPYAPGEIPETLKAFVEALGPDDLVVRITSDEVVEMQELAQRDDTRDRLLAQLLFATRDLAEAQIEPATNHERAYCVECFAEEKDGAIAHGAGCKVARVLSILKELCEVAKAAASVPDATGDSRAEGGAR